MTFESLGVKPEIIKALHGLGIIEPTLIQEKTFSLIREGNDVIGVSKTGSGKTAAFGVPLLDALEMHQGLQILIIAPTRELVVQIAKEMQKFSKYIHAHVASIFGGVALEPQIHNIQKAHVIVGTPGRLLDHLNRGTLKLSGIRTIVLDEADKMVEMGFIQDIRKILNYCSENRQVLLFGATISSEIDDLKHSYMKHPKMIQGEPKVKEELLKQYYYDVQSRDKFSLLVHILKKEQPERAMIFCSRRSTVELIAKNLRHQHIAMEMIHGKLSQNRRLRVMENFNNGHPKVLVASTVAARGLHIENVTHVINYDLSQDSAEYIHRVGRTARAGAEGKAITLLSEHDYGVFQEILSRHDLKVERLPEEDFERLRFDVRMERREFSGQRGFGARPIHRSRGGARPGPGRYSKEGGHSDGSGHAPAHRGRGRGSSEESPHRGRGYHY